MGQEHLKRQNVVGATNENSSLLIATAWLKTAFSSLEERWSDVTLRHAIEHFVQGSLSPSLCIPLD